MNTTDLFNSPDNVYALRTKTREVSHGKWVVSPELLEPATNELLFVFTNGFWSLDRLVWEGPASLRLRLRKYPGGHQPAALEVVIDCAERTATLGSETFLLGELEPHLEAALSWPPQ